MSAKVSYFSTEWVGPGTSGALPRTTAQDLPSTLKKVTRELEPTVPVDQTVISTLESGFEADMAALKVPGLSWALIDEGTIAHTAGLGVIEHGRPTPVTTGTLFQACSISKPVAALAMLRLVDRGLLDLDEDVNGKLRSWQIPRNGDWQPVVTLRQLVSHSAGLTTSGFPGYRRDDPLPTTTQILDGRYPANTFGVRVDTIPGAQFRYSGGGTMVLQQLLEDVTGTPFAELAAELVLRPIGMVDSTYGQPLHPQLHEHAATAHDELGRPIPGRWHVYPELAAAGLWTTPSDLARFALALRQAYADRADRLLSPRLAAEMLSSQVPSSGRFGGLNRLGLGPFLGGQDNTMRFGHTGGNEGFRCHLLSYRDLGYGAVLMTNGATGGWLIQRALLALATSFGWPDYPAELDEQLPPDIAALEACTGTYRVGSLTMTIAHDNTRLLVGFDTQQVIPFVPTADGHFATGVAGTHLRIERSGSAEPTLLFVQNEQEISCQRQ